MASVAQLLVLGLLAIESTPQAIAVAMNRKSSGLSGNFEFLLSLVAISTEITWLSSWSLLCLILTSTLLTYPSKKSAGRIVFLWKTTLFWCSSLILLFCFRYYELVAGAVLVPFPGTPNPTSGFSHGLAGSLSHIWRPVEAATYILTPVLILAAAVWPSIVRRPNWLAAINLFASCSLLYWMAAILQDILPIVYSVGRSSVRVLIHATGESSPNGFVDLKGIRLFFAGVGWVLLGILMIFPAALTSLLCVKSIVKMASLPSGILGEYVGDLVRIAMESRSPRKGDLSFGIAPIVLWNSIAIDHRSNLAAGSGIGLRITAYNIIINVVAGLIAAVLLRYLGF